MKRLGDLLFRACAQPTWLCRADSLHLVEANDAACRRYGLRREEFLDLRLNELADSRAPRLLRTLFLPHGSMGAWRHYFDDGTVHEITVRADILEQDGAQYRLVLSEDITSIESRKLDERRFASLVGRLAEEFTGAAGWELHRASGQVRFTADAPYVFGQGFGPLPNPRAIDRRIVLRHVVPATRGPLVAAIEACMADRRRIDITFATRDVGGCPRWLHIVAEPDFDADNHCIGASGLLRDITARRQHETEMRLLQAAIGSAHDCFFILAASPTRTGLEQRLVYANEAFCALLACSAQQAMERGLAQFHGPRTSPEAQQRIAQAMLREDASSEDLHVQTLTGADLLVHQTLNPVRDGQGQVRHWIGTLRDVGEQRRSEAHARANAERLQMLAKVTTDVIWDWDVAAGRIWWSDTCAQVLGCSPAELQSPGDWLDRVVTADRKTVAACVDEMRHGKRDQWQGEYTLTCGDGHNIVVFDRAFVLRDGSGQPRRIIGSKTDVSELTHLRERVFQVEKLAAMGELTGVVAHDFNNILAIIVGNLEVIQDNFQPRSTELLTLSHLTLSAAQRAVDLTSRLMTFGGRQALRTMAIDINRHVRDTIPLMARALPAATRVDFEPDPSLPPVSIDPAQLDMALLNLVLNARDAMPDGGRIVIATARTAFRTTETRHGELTPGDYVVLTVRDTGAGMSQEVLARALDPFFTTKALGQGNGLGLSSVYGFTRQSGGTVHISSAPGAGTSVQLYVPVARGAAQSAAHLTGFTAEPDPLPLDRPVAGRRRG